MAIDLGNLPSWLALAAVATGVLTYVAKRREDARSLAAKVHVVCPLDIKSDVEPLSPGEGGADGDLKLTDRVVGRLINDSDAPIFDAEINVWGVGRRLWLWRARGRTGWMTGRATELTHVVTVVPPKQHVDFTSPIDLSYDPSLSKEEIRRIFQESRRDPPVTLIFRDGRGKRWVRWPKGQLSRLYLVAYEVDYETKNFYFPWRTPVQSEDATGNS